MNKLGRALCSFLNSDDAGKLAQVLEYAFKTGRISYEEIEGLIDEDPEDILVLGYRWRLLLPIRAAKGGDWEDRILLSEPGEIYHMPNVARHLVENANKTGHWNPEKAIIEVFRKIQEPDSDRMPALVERMASKVKSHRIDGIQIKKMCTELGLGERVDPLLSELKACGIISSKLSSLTDPTRVGSPIYELNPSLFVGETLEESE